MMEMGYWFECRRYESSISENSPYYYNYVIKYFVKQNGVFNQIDLDPPFSSRIPVLTPLDPGKAIKENIVDTFELDPNPGIHDTIQFKAFI